MNNKEQFKRIINLFASMVIISIFALSFSQVWNDSYNDQMLDPFWKNGNILLVLIYTVMYIFVANSFGAFHLGYYTELSFIGSQLLGMVITNVLAFVIISLIGRGRLSAVPMLGLSLYELFILILWVYVFSFLFSKLYPPRRMIIVYGNTNARFLVEKMGSRDDKYVICEAIGCDEGYDRIINRINEYEAVIISDIPHELRSELLKYCLDNSIRVYINPKLSDIIIRGADEFNMFDTPLLLNRNSGLKFEQKLFKRTLDIVFSFIGIIIASPFMLLTVAGAVLTWLYLSVVCRRLYGPYYNEGLISMYGMLTGTISSGVLLLREIDPELKTPAANNLITGSSFGILFGAPVLVLITMAAKSDLMCYVTLGLATLYLLILLLIIYKVGKKNPS